MLATKWVSNSVFIKVSSFLILDAIDVSILVDVFFLLVPINYGVNIKRLNHSMALDVGQANTSNGSINENKLHF